MQNKNSYVLFKTCINSPRPYDNIPNYSNTSNIVYKNNPILHFVPMKGEQIIEPHSNNSARVETPLVRDTFGVSHLTSFRDVEGSLTGLCPSVFRNNLEDFSVAKVDNKKTKTNKNRVKFAPIFNKIIIIHGLSFYNENNIKKDIWWTVAELNTMRNLLIAEVNRLRMINPQRTIQQCIREICTK